MITLILGLLPILFLTFIIAIIVLAIKFLIGKFEHARPAGRNEILHYQSQEKLLTPAELLFFKALEEAVGEKYRIVAKVRLADVIKVRYGLQNSEWRRQQNRIDRKHVDFLLCHHDDFRILAAIELDDASHKRSDRIDRDDFLDAAMLAAGVPLQRFTARRYYSAPEIKAILAGLALPDMKSDERNPEKSGILWADHAPEKRDSRKS